jgi:hypothetical protein
MKARVSVAITGVVDEDTFCECQRVDDVHAARTRVVRCVGWYVCVWGGGGGGGGGGWGGWGGGGGGGGGAPAPRPAGTRRLSDAWPLSDELVVVTAPTDSAANGVCDTANEDHCKHND